MNNLPKSVQNLIDHFSRLPAIGPKSASRIVFFLLQIPKKDIIDFSETLKEVSLNISFCEICHNISENKLCNICNSKFRNEKELIVVEDVLDLLAFEGIGNFKGKYHVLGGAISPLNGIGPEEINIGTLLNRISRNNKINEVIIATSPNLEGEATAMYISNEIKKISNLKISRIARGVPSGADLDYTDRITLSKALSGRIQI